MFRGLFQLGFEIAVVCGAGCVVGLAYNSLRENPIRIHKNYFERPKAAVESAVPSESKARMEFSEEDAYSEDMSSSTLNTQMGEYNEEMGVYTVDFDTIVPLFEEGQETGAFLFIDARDDAHFGDSHLPGAVQIDHYMIDSYLPDAMPYIEMADHVVIYCNGGDCEDSLFVYQDLLDVGVPATKLFLYKGGFAEWVARGMAVEGEEQE